MLGLRRGTVKLVEDHDDWAWLFEQEKKLLEKIFLDQSLAIEHVGSTAIPGVPAKPIIDIRVSVRTLEDAYIEQFVKPLEDLGYHYMHKFPDRHFFAKGPEENRTHHVSIVKAESAESAVLFRDYLRKNKQAREEYSTLKRELATKFANDRASYAKAKEGFIEKSVELARLG